jgi:hypothetical protein
VAVAAPAPVAAAPVQERSPSRTWATKSMKTPPSASSRP